MLIIINIFNILKIVYPQHIYSKYNQIQTYKSMK